MNERTRTFAQLLTAALLSGAFVSTVTGVILTGYITGVEQEVRSQRVWREQSVSELLGPMNIQFDRTKRAFERWTDRNLYLEAKVIKIGNETIRDLLLTKGHLIPTQLLDDAGTLIEHYDVWLELFEQQRGAKEPDLESTFTFAGPAGYPFPKEAEQRFRETYKRMWNDLYGKSDPNASNTFW